MVSYVIQRMILSLLVGADLVVGRVALSVTSKQKQRLSRETVEVESSAKRTSRNEVLVHTCKGFSSLVVALVGE